MNQRRRSRYRTLDSWAKSQELLFSWSLNVSAPWRLWLLCWCQNWFNLDKRCPPARLWTLSCVISHSGSFQHSFKHIVEWWPSMLVLQYVCPFKIWEYVLLKDCNTLAQQGGPRVLCSWNNTSNISSWAPAEQRLEWNSSTTIYAFVPIYVPMDPSETWTCFAMF